MGDPKQIHLTFQHPKENWPAFLGVKLDESSYDILVDESADVFTPEGDILFRFRKKCLPKDQAAKAFDHLKKIYEISVNRGIANGRMALRTVNEPYIKKDGSLSRYNRGLGALIAKNAQTLFGSSSIIGYVDRYPRRPYCRETAYTAKHTQAFHGDISRFFRSVNEQYQKMDPDRYRLQQEVVNRTSPDFVIRGTSYTTVTVNQSFQTAVHTDQGDLKAGLSNILVLRQGKFSGGHLVFPHYRAAVRLDSLDLMCFDSHHMHGNTPIVGVPGSFRRLSCVLYYRERMQDCGSAAEELERAKRRKLGDKLHGKI